jgi:hypothetical protein
MNKFSWLGTISAIAGSFCLSFGIMFLGYVALTMGCIIWAIVNHLKKDKPGFTMQIVLLAPSLIGLIRNF